MARSLNVAVVLAGASVVLAAAALVASAVCGGMEVGGRGFANGTTESFGPRCVSSLHPLLPGALAGTLFGLAGAWHGRPRVALAVGGALLLLSLVLIFSLGAWGVFFAPLLLVAGVLTKPSAEAPPWLRVSTAFASVAALFGLGLAGTFAFQRGAPTGDSLGALLVAPLLAGTAALAVLARFRWAATAFAAAGVAWGLWRLPVNALGDLLPAAFAFAGAVALWSEARVAAPPRAGRAT